TDDIGETRHRTRFEPRDRISASRLKPSDDVLIAVPLPYGRVALQAKPTRATRSSRMCGRLADARPPRRATRPLPPAGQAPVSCVKTRVPEFCRTKKARVKISLMAAR